LETPAQFLATEISARRGNIRSPSEKCDMGVNNLAKQQRLEGFEVNHKMKPFGLLEL
jgi:hypothetical protein